MKERVKYLEAGYADLALPRILFTIFFILGLIAIPNYFEYQERTKLMSVVNDLQQSVVEYYTKTKQLPDIEKAPVIPDVEYVDTQNKQYRINLSVINSGMEYQYLKLQPFLNQETIDWECSFDGDIYQDQIPVLSDGLCQSSRLVLEERTLLERLWEFVKRLWKFILGYVLLIGFTFLFG